VRREHQIETGVRRDVQGLAGRPARTECTRGRWCAPVTATRGSNKNARAHEKPHFEPNQRSQEAYLSRQSAEAIRAKLEDLSVRSARAKQHQFVRKAASTPSFDRSQRAETTEGLLRATKGVSNAQRRNERTRTRLAKRTPTCVNASTHAGTSTKQLLYS
jgi:hypothetical protein